MPLLIFSLLFVIIQKVPIVEMEEIKNKCKYSRKFPLSNYPWKLLRYSAWTNNFLFTNALFKENFLVQIWFNLMKF